MKEAAVTLLLLLCACAAGTDSGATSRERALYLAPNGTDTASGTLARPLRTLAGALSRAKALGPDSDLAINCVSDKGTFFDQFVEWDYSMPGHRISFRGYPKGSYARFEMTAEAARDAPFFLLAAKRSAPTNLVFDHLVVANYNAGAIWFIGGWPASEGGWNGRNLVTYCTFDSIGNIGRPQAPLCYGVIDCVASIGNVIEHCTFHDCRNAGRSVPPIVAIYLAHGSSRNTIRANTFREIEGAGVKLRDRSNANRITGNLFVQVGYNAGLLQVPNADIVNWYCDESLMELDCGPPEGPSDSCIISDNVSRGDYYCMMPAIYIDAMRHLIPTVRCNPCLGKESVVTLKNNSVEGCPAKDR
jgi:hypothetical protein